jgi:hypothetical protein
MADYHLHVGVLGRKPTAKRPRGGNAIAAAAYRAGERLRDERDGRTHDYTRKTEVVHREILAPAGAPTWIFDRAALWNAVERGERQSNSQLARDFDIALPIELGQEAAVQLARDWVQRSLVDRGMVADFAVHWADGNPHMHVLATMRDVGPEGFGAKHRAWNDRGLVEEWRAEWEAAANAALERAGHDARIDRRTLNERGIDRDPTTHLGPRLHAQQERVDRDLEAAQRDLDHARRQARFFQELMDEEIAGNRISVERDFAGATRWERWRTEILSERYRVEAEDVANTRIPRYWRVRTIQDREGRGFLEIRNASGVVRDYGTHIACVQASAFAIDAMLQLAAMKGWTAPKISGQDVFVELALREALDRGFVDVRVDAQHQELLDQLRAEQAARGYHPDGRVIPAADFAMPQAFTATVVGLSADGRQIYVGLGRGDVVAIDRSVLIGTRVDAGDRVRLDAAGSEISVTLVDRDRPRGNAGDRDRNLGRDGRDEPEIE